MIHVSNFLTLGQDENEKMKLILNFNNFINKFERNINKYLKLAFNKLNYEIAEENEYNNPKELIMNDKATNKDIPVYGVFDSNRMEELYYIVDMKSNERVYLKFDDDCNVIIDEDISPEEASLEDMELMLKSIILKDVIIDDLRDMFKLINKLSIGFMKSS